jgi:hypothetical protein
MTPPPVDMHAAQTPSYVFLAAMATFFVVSLAWAVRRTLAGRSALPLLALLGGGIASLEEPWIDRLIQLWYPADAPHVMFTWFGIHQPLYMHLSYPGFIGLGGYVTYLGLCRHPDGRTLPKVFLGICAMDLAFEMPSTFFGVYHYYGTQPYQLFADGWPMWVAPVNATGPLVGGWLMYRFRDRLTGPRVLGAALLPPLAYAGVYGATTWPTTTALNSDTPTWVLWAAATVTMALATAVMLGVRSLAAAAAASPTGSPKTLAGVS